MSFFSWAPWKILIKYASRRYGIINPLDILAKMRSFAQPSEVAEPMELVRAGILFHARGLINTRVIQHNLDWVWPFWVEKQFNPMDPSFIPRAFSFSHVNLTHRNWTAVGSTGCNEYPIVDPRGLVTPIYDGWSIDFWIIDGEGNHLIPSKLNKAVQTIEWSSNLCVTTTLQHFSKHLSTRVCLLNYPKTPVVKIHIEASAKKDCWLAVALRPYNPEGIQFIEKISYVKELPALRINSEQAVLLSDTPESVIFSNYRDGDVVHKLPAIKEMGMVECKAGMATAAALFPISKSDSKTLDIHIPIKSSAAKCEPVAKVSDGWEAERDGSARLDLPDNHIVYLYHAAIRTLLLLSEKDPVPGPYTYKRFWFRDACFMLHALLVSGFAKRVFRILNGFPEKQKLNGFFQSQEGEWDSNGQVIWIMDRFFRLTGQQVGEDWLESIFHAADWIQKKRLIHEPPSLHEGLLPPGFSAEHFGPNDYYYWDDFWGLAGLRSAADLAEKHDAEIQKNKYRQYAKNFEDAIFSSINAIPGDRSRGCIPASPYRRMDAGAIGSLVADYPLQIAGAGDSRILNTVNFLIDKCFCNGAFFQDMIHSGINPYLTLCIAQSLLRNRDERYHTLIRVVQYLASPTGQWPEAIHPQTGGGCMGDGQHGWAAAEWVMMIRNLFVREEGDGLVIGSGIFPEWMNADTPVFFGPTLTPFGKISVRILKEPEGKRLSIDASWRDQRPSISVQVPGFAAEKIDGNEYEYLVVRSGEK